MPLVPGRIERIRIPLLPVAWRFAAGSRLRLSIAGADDDHCGQVPHGRPPLMTLLWGEGQESVLELPMVAEVVSSLSPSFTCPIHTSRSCKVVPYLMRWKASRPKRIVLGPGLP
jgi:hypothetical protein